MALFYLSICRGQKCKGTILLSFYVGNKNKINTFM